MLDQLFAYEVILRPVDHAPDEDLPLWALVAKRVRFRLARVFANAADALWPVELCIKVQREGQEDAYMSLRDQFPLN